MAPRVHVDREYRTGLGTGFYDRLEELEQLDTGLAARKTLVVYGPRNVGKSELIRYYFLRRARGFSVVAVDARRRVLETLGVDAGGLRQRLQSLAGKLLAATVGPGLADIVREAADLLRGIQGELVIVVDEFHLLHPDPVEALVELERAAGLLAKNVEGPRLVVTVSEGFIATMEARWRLTGYSTGYLLVEGLDEDHMRALYEEYRRLHGCGSGFETIWGLFGGAAGYLLEACPLTVEQLRDSYIPGLLELLDAGLARAAEELGLEPRTVLERTWWLLEKSLRGGAARLDPRGRRLAETLVRLNILYPCGRVCGPVYGERYLPQLPLYGLAIEAAAEAGLDGVASLPPGAILGAAPGSPWGGARCCSRPRLQL